MVLSAYSSFMCFFCLFFLFFMTWFDLHYTGSSLCEALSSSLVDLKWLIMFATVQRFYDSTHLAYGGPIMKLTRYSLHSSTKWITVKCCAGCIQNGWNKIAVDGVCDTSGKKDCENVSQENENMRIIVILIVPYRLHWMLLIFWLFTDLVLSDLYVCRHVLEDDGWNPTQCNGGSKPQQSCGTAQNMKSNLINHCSLSCVAINIQCRAEKLFESD